MGVKMSPSSIMAPDFCDKLPMTWFCSPGTKAYSLSHLLFPPTCLGPVRPLFHPSTALSFHVPFLFLLRMEEQFYVPVHQSDFEPTCIAQRQKQDRRGDTRRETNVSCSITEGNQSQWLQ